MTGQADRLGVTIKADIVKQKLPKVHNLGNLYGWGGFFFLFWSHGASDLRDAVITAVINKRAGGMGLISGRKAFQKSMNKGVELLNAIQDVYLDPAITIA